MITTADPPSLPRVSVTEQLRSRLAYEWNNSSRRAPRLARRWWDGRGGRLPVVVSNTAHGDLSIAYAGVPAGRVNILQLLEHQRAAIAGPVADRLCGTSTWPELRTGRLPDADLVVIGCEAHRVRSLPRRGALVAPFRVHLVIDLADGIEAVRQRISKRERWEFRRSRARHGWTLAEDSSIEALAYFYHRMHVPTMRARHGDRGRSESLEVASHAILGSGRLFFVRADETPVAGVLCQISAGGRRVTTRLLGVLDGDDTHYRSGAFKAVYHLLLEWASAHGASEVDLFGTEAFMSKGIFQWKRRLAPRVVLPPNHFATKRICLYARRDTPAVRDFLVANPLLTLGDGGLRPLYFTDSQRPARFDISSRCSALAEPEIRELDDFLAGAA